MDDTASTVPALVAFFAATFGWMVLVGILTAALIFAGNPNLAQADFEQGLTPVVLGASAALQATGMGAISLLLARSFGPSAFPWSTRWGWFVAAGVGGLTVGLLPAYLASQLAEFMPRSGLDVLASALRHDGTPGRLLLTFGICVAAPIGEELAFRGYLWGQLERVAPPVAVWLITSLLFAGYHLDPVQAPALIPTALFLGWVRWASGSIGPAIVGHFTNNALAFAAMLHLVALPSASITTAAAGTMATVSTSAFAWWMLKRT